MNLPTDGILSGLRILDICTLIAGPFATTLLADFGAEVVKLDLPDGSDPLRNFPDQKNGVPLWYRALNRNKKGITLDVRKEHGKELFKRLVTKFDVVVENFRPGTLEGWGLGPEVLLALNPKLIVLRISGFGQTGPYRRRPGFARLGEAVSGFTVLCGEPEGPPLHASFPTGDFVSGLYGALGIALALINRHRDSNAPGQVIDVSLYESIFRMMDQAAIVYDQTGTVAARNGNAQTYSAPANVFQTKDGLWVTLVASSQNTFRRLVQSMGRPDLESDPRFVTNPVRFEHRVELEAIIGEWIAARTLEELMQLVDEEGLTLAPILDIGQIFTNPHFQARENLITLEDPVLGPVRLPNVTPRLSHRPGSVWRTGPDVGEHNAEVYRDLLGLSEEDLAALRANGAV